MKQQTVLPEVPESGLSFTYRESDSSENKAFSALLNLALRYLIALALSFGALLSFTTMYEIPFNGAIFSVYAVVLSLALTLVYQLSKKVVGIVSLSLLAALLAVVWIFWTPAADGFVYVKDFVVSGICEKMFWDIPELSYVFVDAMKAQTTFFLCLLATPLITGIVYFTVRKPHFIPPFAFTVPFFEIGAFFGRVPNHFCFAALFAGRIGLFAMWLVSTVRRVRRRKGDKKKVRVTAARRGRSLAAAIGAGVVAVSFVLFSIGDITTTAAGYNHTTEMLSLRDKIQKTTASILDYLSGEDHDGSLKDGRLYMMEDRDIQGRRYMTLSMPRSESTYLRGFVGVNYATDRWLPYDEKLNGDEELTALYEETGYYPQAMQGMLTSSQITVNNYSEFAAGAISISKLRREKDYAYTAYIPYYSDEFTFTGDTTAFTADMSAYSYTAFMGQRNFYSVNQAELYQEENFAAVWKAYQKYVKETYVKLPKETDYTALQAVVDGLEAGKDYGYAGRSATNLETADRIRTYLAEQIAYSLKVETLPAETDFVQWILSGDKTGYSAHYATAMTVLLRLANVPARYVEGYRITGEDFETAQALGGGLHSLTVTDKNAHAWVEIYESNYGWIPIEVTPGFYTGSLLDGDWMASFDDVEEVPEEPIEDVEDDPLADDEVETETNLVDVTPEYDYDLEDEEPVDPFLRTLMYLAFTVGGVILGVIVLIALAMWVLFVRRAVRLSWLRKSLVQSDRNRRIASVYQYYNRLLRFEKLENAGNLPYMQYAAYICENSERLEGQRHVEAMQIFLKHRFSNEAISDAELATLEALVTDYRNTALQQFTGKQKFRFMFVENLG